MVATRIPTAASGRHALAAGSRGFTYIGLLILIAIMGAVLAATGEVWRTVQLREKEKELLFVGEQFRRAIGQFYESTPGAHKHYPLVMEDLLLDKRYVTPRRHLRKIYRDPMTGDTEWGIVRTSEGRIMGVYSRAEGTPFKTGNFPEALKYLEGKQSYSEWKFVYVPANLTTRPGPNARSPAGQGQQQTPGPSGSSIPIPAPAPSTRP